MFWNMSATAIFIVFAFANNNLMKTRKITQKRLTELKKFNKLESKKEIEQCERTEKFMKTLDVEEEVTGKDKTIVKSKLTSAGYLLMLIIRLSGELVFIRTERELAKHQSGVQCGFFDYRVVFLKIQIMGLLGSIRVIFGPPF